MPADFPLRFVTATSLFDGHDASINIMRRILQAEGAEVIHLGHNRSVEEIVKACIEEDVHGVAISSYQGGHVEFFKYLVDELKNAGREQIAIFGGGGGVIVPAEIEELQTYGVEKIYSPHDGQALGLKGMIQDMLERARCKASAKNPVVSIENNQDLARALTWLENGLVSIEDLVSQRTLKKTPVLGFTGTGGAGKSSLVDEILNRFTRYLPRAKIAVLAVDPTKRKTGGALLGDRIRMNSLSNPQIFMRSIATRNHDLPISKAVPDMVTLFKSCDFDLIVVETSGIGQADSSITHFTDLSLYVMTPEFGAQSQLEKIDMLDFADLVAINKFDKQHAEDALRDVQKQYQRNHEAFQKAPSSMPVYGTQANRFNDMGVNALFKGLMVLLDQKGFKNLKLISDIQDASSEQAFIPSNRASYLEDVVNTVESYHQETENELKALQKIESYQRLADEVATAEEKIAALTEKLLPDTKIFLKEWPKQFLDYKNSTLTFNVRGEPFEIPLFEKSLSELAIPKVALPIFDSISYQYSFYRQENLPGYFPFTGGVFPLKRENEMATRMFAGEGDAFKTNQRFKLLSEGQEAKRLSTAFDSVTLYGFDPAIQPDIYGKVGNAGVSIATLDDMKALYDGFDLCAPSTSVSMTINGPAPTLLAMFLNTAICQRIGDFESKNGREATTKEKETLKSEALMLVRGTVQADILKEDQGQNTCIFSTEFALRMMADVQEYFISHRVKNFYSVSISGYHIAEAGANPITQLAFTLANGFTYVEAYLARGMKIDDFAPHFSFFFSNGMDPEYAVLGRVARRIWAIAMRDFYKANARSQKLKYHVQTSGRSLHAQDMQFNDIRTTLEALIAHYDHCNSLHTNAFDEAVTTPTDASVRRALAIQQIIQLEWGVAKNQNPNQGSFFIEALTHEVEKAVLQEFLRLNKRGGVLGAMESAYQRSKIQEESLYYEEKKHNGSFPIVGVNTFLSGEMQTETASVPLSRSTTAEKESQLSRLKSFQNMHKNKKEELLARLKSCALSGGNTFEVLMDAVQYASLGEITQALFEVGGRYRRNL